VAVDDLVALQAEVDSALRAVGNEPWSRLNGALRDLRHTIRPPKPKA